MSLTVLQRMQDPQTHSAAMTDFVLRREGDAVLDTAVRLEFGVTVTGATTGFDYDFARRAGAFALINAIEVLSEGGSSLYRLDRANMFAAFQNMRADVSKIADLNDLLNSSQLSSAINAEGQYEWYRKELMRVPFTSSAATTRRVILDLRLIVSMLRQLWPLQESGDLRVRILWEDNTNIWEGDGFSSYAISEPHLCYQLLNLGDKLPKSLRGKQTVSFLQPTLAMQRIPAVATGATQRQVVPLGYASETVGSLMVALVGDDYLVRATESVKGIADYTNGPAQANAGQKNIVLTSNAGIAINDRIYAGGLVGDPITAVDADGVTITTTTALVSDIAAGATVQIMVSGPVPLLTEFAADGAANAGQKVITLADVQDLYPGDRVYSKANALAPDTFIESVDRVANAITLNNDILTTIADTDKFYVSIQSDGKGILQDFRSDTQKDALVNLKIDGRTEFPSMQNVGDQLGLLVENYGKLTFPASAYGNCEADLCAEPGMRDFVGYMGFDISRRVSDDIEFELQRTGAYGFKESGLGIYAWGECLRGLVIERGVVTRVA